MYNLVPQGPGAYLLLVHGLVRVDGELLHVGLVVHSCLHEGIVDFHRYVGSRHLAFGHLGIDEGFRVGVLDAHRQHQCAAPAVLCHFACGVAVALHEGHQTCGGEGGVVDGRALGTDVGEVVAHASPAFHQLHLLLIDAHDGTVRVGVAFQADDKAVAQRGNLVVVADAGHGAACRHDVAEVVEQGMHLVGTHGVGVLLLDACHLVGDTPVHVFGRLFVDVAETVFHRVLVHPYACGQFVAFKILQRGLICLIMRVYLVWFHIVFVVLI